MVIFKGYVIMDEVVMIKLFCIFKIKLEKGLWLNFGLFFWKRYVKYYIYFEVFVIILKFWLNNYLKFWFIKEIYLVFNN